MPNRRRGGGGVSVPQLQGQRCEHKISQNQCYNKHSDMVYGKSDSAQTTRSNHRSEGQVLSTSSDYTVCFTVMLTN